VFPTLMTGHIVGEPTAFGRCLILRLEVVGRVLVVHPPDAGHHLGVVGWLCVALALGGSWVLLSGGATGPSLPGLPLALVLGEVHGVRHRRHVVMILSKNFAQIFKRIEKCDQDYCDQLQAGEYHRSE